MKILVVVLKVTKGRLDGDDGGKESGQTFGHSSKFLIPKKIFENEI